jgi:hypothetical protein
MTPRLRVVSPFRPFAAESVEHLDLGPFDWVAALEMLQWSVRRNCPNTEAVAITDVDTDLPVPALSFKTTERRLMLWILDVSLRYLESSAFDRDTVMVSPDMLVLGDLRPWFTADLGVLVRPEQKHRDSGRTVMNQVQWWSHQAKPALIAFYRQALAIARTLPENVITWGADTEPIRQLIEPIELGVCVRGGLSVSLIHFGSVMVSLSKANIDRLAMGEPILVGHTVLDFKYTRKQHMRAAFESLYGVAA